MHHVRWALLRRLAIERAILPVLVLGLGACVPAPVTPPLPDHLDVDRRLGEEPPIGVRTQRNVGEVIYENYNYEIRTDSSARLLGSINIAVLLASASLGPADPLVATTDQGEQVHCTASPALNVAGAGAVAHICLRDVDSDARFDQWRSPDGPPARRGWAQLKEDVGYKEETNVLMAQTGGFKYELLYQGISSGVVSILYREYLDSLVRPAFQQDLSYTLQPVGPTDISFRTIQITVESADNNAIVYVVKRGLDPG